MRVECERTRPPAAQRALEHEIECAEQRQLVPHDVALHDPAEVRLYPRRSHPAHEERIVRRVVRDQRDVRRVALVSRAGMGELAQRAHQATSHSIAVWTSSRSTKVDVTPTRSRVDLATPPPPAGPLV